jgi:hypothetical protein
LTINSNTQNKSINLNHYKNSNAPSSSNKTKEANKDLEKMAILREKYPHMSDDHIRLTEKKKEFYSKVVEIDKTFDNPLGHIHNKYYNSSSPYYIEGLTKEERDAAYNNESCHFRGLTGQIDYRDPLFKDEMPIYGDVEVAQVKAANRQAMNEKFEQLLASNNITIPEDTKLRFTINPNDYSISVSGTDDLELTNLIENMFDEDKGKELFYHIIQSRSDDSTQYSEDKFTKYSLVRQIKESTGYDLNDLDVVDGKFVTKDGTDILDIFAQSVREGTQIPEEFKSIYISSYAEDLAKFAKEGLNSVDDLVLSIDYENGSFYDVGQSKNYGTGKTQWIDELIASKPKSYIYA